jgi:hypothetical protein
MHVPHGTWFAKWIGEWWYNESDSELLGELMEVTWTLEDHLIHWRCRGRWLQWLRREFTYKKFGSIAFWICGYFEVGGKMLLEVFGWSAANELFEKSFVAS